MPRVSMKYEDAMMGFGVQEGYFEITKSVAAVHQYPPNSKTGIQSAPFTAVRWSMIKLNEDWSVPEEPENVTVNIRIGELDQIRPGKLKNPENLDEEPEDLHDEVNTEGNSLYGEPGSRVSGQWGRMDESLRQRNFREDIVDRQYLPDYVGMKFHLKTVEAGEYRDKKTGEMKKATNLVCDKIHTYPYDKKGSKKGSKSKTKDEPDSDPLETVKALLMNLSEPFKKAVPTGKPIKRSMFTVQFQLELGRQKIDRDLRTEVLALLKDDDIITALADDVGFVVDLDENTVTFP